MNGENEKLISIDEVIERAKRLGVDFGKGDPRNRLRYYVKIGLLPHAKRKAFKNKFPEGAYPEEIVWKLFEIDRMIKAGKGILQIKKEMEEKERKEKERVFVLPKFEEKIIPKRKLRIPFVKLLSIFFATFILFFFLNIKFNFQKSISYFLAAIMTNFKKLVQAPVPATPELERKETFEFPETEPYLTINAETAIKGSLNVRDSVTSPSFVIKRETYNATLATAPLTADRTYTFPDQSGIVCLSTGNCVGLAGEVLSPGGTPNRLAKFIGGRRIGDSSIQDFFTGVLITISSGGNVGIGIENPQYPLHVRGRIQATGDICTDLGGGKCLSQLAPPVAIGRGIGGSGTTNYIPIWTSATTLGNSILSQIGSTLTLTGNMNIAGLLTTSAFRIATTTHAGYILVAADDQGNITFAPPPSGAIPSGTKLLRASIPIFKYSTPAQTTSTSFVSVSNRISTSTLLEILPQQIENSQRKFALLIKFADNIPQNASSTWRIEFENNPPYDFEFQGQNLPSLDSGILRLKDGIENLASDNWTLKVEVPSSENAIRIFNIYLLCYDEIL